MQLHAPACAAMHVTFACMHVAMATASSAFAAEDPQMGRVPQQVTEQLAKGRSAVAMVGVVGET